MNTYRVIVIDCVDVFDFANHYASDFYSEERKGKDTK
jgi:hypothetical protein